MKDCRKYRLLGGAKDNERVYGNLNLFRIQGLGLKYMIEIMYWGYIGVI